MDESVRNVLILAVPAAALVGMQLWHKKPSASPGDVNTMAPERWSVGPTINGVNESVGMALHPTKHPLGLQFDLGPGKELHYATRSCGNLAAKRQITARFRIEGSELHPVKLPDSLPTLTLYFQRAGDNWGASHEAYRWYAKFANQVTRLPGEYIVTAPLDGDWSAALTSKRSTNPAAFEAALIEATEVGFVCGGADGLGHGVTADEPAKLILTSFEVE